MTGPGTDAQAAAEIDAIAASELTTVRIDEIPDAVSTAASRWRADFWRMRAAGC